MTWILALLLLAPPSLATEARQIAAREGANLQRPAWSPDGVRLAYEANFHDKRVVELWVGEIEGLQFQRVTPTVRGASAMTAGFSTSRAAGGQVAHELSWAPPEIGRFVYSATSDDRVFDLFLGGGGALISSSSTDGGPAWSPDGRHIVFTSSRTGQGDLYLLDLNRVDRPPRQLTRDPTAAELFATWSPDGRRLVYVGHSQQGDNLWLLPTLDAAPVRLTDWPRSQVRPTFSPDGSKIAFYANREDETRFDLYVMEARTGARATRLLEGVVLNANGPAWAPGGRHIVAALADDGRFNPVVAVPVAQPEQVQPLELGTVNHGDLDVVRGPDGKIWLAYVAQGRVDDEERSFRRLFVAPITLP